LLESFERLVFEDGAGILRCPDARTLRFQRNEFAFSFTAVFGMTVRVAGNGRALGQNIGRRKSRQIESVTGALHTRCGNLAIR
jgi:hypothetical protein